MRKDCVARELTMEMVVGAFMVMILLGLGYFTIILAREPLLQRYRHIGGDGGLTDAPFGTGNRDSHRHFGRGGDYLVLRLLFPLF